MAGPVFVGAVQRRLRLFNVEAVTTGASGLPGGPLGVGVGGGGGRGRCTAYGHGDSSRAVVTSVRFASDSLDTSSIVVCAST